MENSQQLIHFGKSTDNHIELTFAYEDQALNLWEFGWTEISREEYELLYDLNANTDSEEYKELVKFLENESIGSIEVNTYTLNKINKVLNNKGVVLNYSQKSLKKYKYLLQPETREGFGLISKIIDTDFRKVKLVDFKI